MLKEFDEKTLAQFDGINNSNKYIAVDGFVYDVTNNSHWMSVHHGYLPGKDYSNEINNAPHGKKVLEKLTIVGTYKK
ncbi:cytochrome b5-like heme/steroid binding domain-containing protein [Enterococcus hirae]|uniref:cytochrome b5 domain-containing protein n=1 Tax=Enterococcus hirae TaxID=1354 RepID=UPI000BA02058|nr:cytochrome b5 domain-containing protein [Enterococcus hirae]OZS41185.1 cytochrome B5 [Enterococcus hirae]PWG75725.1 cytochrome B5 [Enterococcus hirae]